MSASRVFHTRGTATENASSMTCSLVRCTAKLPRAAEWSRVPSEAITQFCEVSWCGALLNVEHQGAELELYSVRHWQPVEPLSER